MATKKSSKKKTSKKAVKKTVKKSVKKSAGRAATKKGSSVKKATSAKKKTAKKKASSRVVAETSSSDEMQSMMDVASDRDLPDLSSQDYSTPTFSSGVSMEDEKRQGPPVMAIVLGVIVVAILLFVARDIWMGPDSESPDAGAEQTEAVIESPQGTEQSGEESTTSEPVEEESADSSEGNAEATGNVEYTVKSSDTGLYQIASDQLGKGSRWKEIQELNKNVLNGGTSIKPGMKLKLPAK